MTTPLYPILAKYIEDEWIRLERNQITPWAFMNTEPPFRCKDFYGKEIPYQGIGFEGSPNHVFWGRYIEPFLEDITERTVQETINLAKDKQQKANEPLIEVSALLKALARRTYDRMATIDQRLLGEGFPEKITLKNVDDKFASMSNFIDQRINSELAMTKRKCSINDFYNNQPFLFWFIASILAVILAVKKF